MKKDNSVYDSIYRQLKKGPISFTLLYQVVVKETGKNISKGSLRTTLYRQVKKGTIGFENSLYFMGDKKMVESKNTIEDKKIEMLVEYIDKILSITKEYDEKFTLNPFEEYQEDGELLGAKKVYLFNKQVKNLITEKLKEIEKNNQE